MLLVRVDGALYRGCAEDILLDTVEAATVVEALLLRRFGPSSGLKVSASHRWMELLRALELVVVLQARVK